MKALVTSFFSGLVFALGLGISGMSNPNKVLGFLDFFGAWDPSLAFVMGGAVGINLVLFRLILKRPKPRFDLRFHLPTFHSVDARLIGGSALFGLGWGLAGYCPGAAVAAVPTGAGSVLLFLAAMVGGMLAYRAFEAVMSHRPAAGPMPEVAAAE